MVTPLITNDLEEWKARVESELRALREENRKLKSRWDLLDTYLPLVHVDGLEIGRDFFRGEQGFLQFATGTGAERAVLYFVTTLDSDPGSVDPRGEIVGSASANGLSLFLRSRKSSTQSVEVELDSDVANYPALKVNVAGASSTAAGFAVYSEFQTVDFDLAGDNIKLPVGGSDSTFTGLGDGLLNYRSDLDRARLRANGAWVSLAHLSDALTAFTGGGNWKVLYQDGSGAVTELALGAAGTVLTSNGASSAPTFEAVSGGMELVVQEADQTINSQTTLQNTELTFSVAANEVWQFEGTLFWLSDGTPDIKFAAAGPTGAVGHFGFISNFGATISSFEVPLGTEQAVTTMTRGTLRFWGAIHNGANAGSLTVQFAQNTSDAADTTIRAGSYIKYQQES